MATLIAPEGRRLKYIIAPKVQHTMEAFMALEKNVWRIMSEENKRTVIAPAIIFDGVRQGLEEYIKTYRPKYKEKELINKAFAQCRAYFKKVYDIAPHIDELMLDNMDGFEEATKEIKQQVVFSLANILLQCPSIKHKNIPKLSELMYLQILTQYAGSYGNVLRATNADQEIDNVARLFFELEGVLSPKFDAPLVPTKHSNEVLDVCCEVLKNKITNYIDNIKFE